MENIEILKEQLPQLTINELSNIVIRLYEGESINSVLDDYIVNIANSSNDIQNVSGIYPSKQQIYSKIESIVGLSLEGEYSGNVELWTKLFDAGWKREL